MPIKTNGLLEKSKKKSKNKWRQIKMYKEKENFRYVIG